MSPFKKKEKEVFLDDLFFQEQKNLSKEQLLFSFLCIVRQKKIQSDPKIFEFFFFLKLLSKFSIFSKGHIFGIFILVS